MATIASVTPALVSGTLLGAAAAAGGGDQFINTGSEFFYVKNGSGGALTVTFDSPATCSFAGAALSSHDSAVSVAAGAERLIGPFPVVRFNDASGYVQVTYSGVTSLTVSVIKP